MVLPHHTQDEKAYVVPMIQYIRRRLRQGDDRKSICDDLTAEGISVEEVYLAYSAAKIMMADDDSWGT